MTAMTRPSVAFSVVDDVLLIAHGKEPPDDATWDRLITITLDLYQRTSFGKTLVTSIGGAPTSAQRHQLNAAIKQVILAKAEPQGRVAIMTSSRFVRLVVEASAVMEQNWFRRQRSAGEGSRVYRAFALNELTQAFGWLNVPHDRERALAKELERLRREVDG
ncbi:MAG TPA: hypothetical protein PK156_42725 [Polyangium sp.]|nr:hypothetical protein [Polyangium sp.]